MPGLHVYIITNSSKSVLYVGVTNNLAIRLVEHYNNRGKQKTFAGRYFCYNLVYFEYHDTAEGGVLREKEIKKWRREKKVQLIESFNPDWNFLNSDVTEWPPEKGTQRFY